ncbi:hypothetical protein F5X96DRAFT_647567 [Biscogniauxia mediterranea]|nr:hypothetical protein F5X96DRAFT_647567 [Biscogniauxia mediterranea]
MKDGSIGFLTTTITCYLLLLYTTQMCKGKFIASSLFFVVVVVYLFVCRSLYS